MNNQFQVRVHSGSLRGQAFVIDKQEFKIGRDPSCDIVLSENAVSRVHLLIYPQAYNSIVLVDNNSTNGTTVNNVQVTAPVQITENDVIMLGGEVALVLEKVPAMQQPAYSAYPPVPQQVPPFQPPFQSRPADPHQPQPGMGEYPGFADPYYGYQQVQQHADMGQPAVESTPLSNLGDPVAHMPEQEIPAGEKEWQSSSTDKMNFPIDPSYQQTPGAGNDPFAQQYPHYGSQQPPQSSQYSQAPMQPPYGSPMNQPYNQSQQQYGQQYPWQAGDPHQAPPQGQSQYAQFPPQQVPWNPQQPYNPHTPYSQNQPYGQMDPAMQQPYPYGNQGNMPYYGQQSGANEYAAANEYEGQDDEAAKKKRLFIILGIVLLLIVAIVIFIIYIDSNYLWCDVFPFLWSPEACAIYP